MQIEDWCEEVSELAMVDGENSNSTFSLRAIRHSRRFGLQMVTDLCHGGVSSNSGEGSRTLKEGEEESCVGQSHYGAANIGQSHNQERGQRKPSALIEHDIAHITQLRSSPKHVFPCLAGKNQGSYVSTYTMLAAREANHSGFGRFSQSDRCHITSRYLPSDKSNRVHNIDSVSSHAYTGQFSSDGSLFIAGFQDRNIKVYDVNNGWRLKKDVLARNLHWTVTDTALSPDQHFLVYSTINPVVHIVNIGIGGTHSVANVTDIHEPLDFSVEADDKNEFGLFCLKFSTDGRELIAGSNNRCIYVYNLETQKITLKLHAHKDDVNTIALADDTGHVIYSGSDDKVCKVWDRRCLQNTSKPAGSLVGHLEGITFIDSRGDGRYFISNGKDQTTKLWDMRKMLSGNPNLKPVRGQKFRWDYRWMEYPGVGKNLKHPCDQSLMTYNGHSVLRTLIRCYFSPVHSTAQKYIYTGSNDGCIYIYDLVSAKQIRKLKYHEDTVRDCSWHPFSPMFVSSSWDGDIVEWECF